MTDARKNAYVLQQLAFEDLGILEPLLRERGYSIRTWEAGEVSELPSQLGPADLLIVLGGPIGVYEEEAYPFLREEKLLVRQWLDKDLAILGICLGAQLIAEALGAPVTPTGRKEIGYAPLTLTPAGASSVLAPLAGEQGEPVPVLHWHGDEFAIPAGAKRLAETAGFPNQAFSVGEKVLALQFHLEADYQRIERWLVGHSGELSAAGIDPTTIREDARRYGPRLAVAAGAVFNGWLDGVALGD